MDLALTNWERHDEHEAILRMAKATERGSTALVVARDHVVSLSRSNTDVAQNVTALQTELTRSVELQAQTVEATERLADDLGEALAEVTAGLDDLAGRIDTGFARLEEGLNRTTAVLSEKLGSIEVKSGWSDAYKRFVSFKKNAFDLAKRRDYGRALEQGLAGLAIVEPGGIADDDIVRDPELNALVAKLLVNGLAEPPASAAATDPFLFAARALEKGRDSEDPAARQAAADGAHLLAVQARATSDLEIGAAFDIESYRLEQQDDVAGLARVYAALTVTEEAEEIGKAIALASIVHPRFLALYLVQPALLADSAMTDAVLRAVRRALDSTTSQAARGIEAQTAAWSTVNPVDAGPSLPELRGAPAMTPDGPLLAVAAGARAALETPLRNDIGICEAIGRHVRVALDEAGCAAGDLGRELERLREIGAGDLARREDQLAKGVLASGGMKTIGCAAPAAWVVLASYFAVATPRSCTASMGDGLWYVLGLAVALIVLWAIGRSNVRSAIETRRQALDVETNSPEGRLRAIDGARSHLRRHLDALPQDLGVTDYMNGPVRSPGAAVLLRADSREYVVEDLERYGDRLATTVNFWLSPGSAARVGLVHPLLDAYVALKREL